MSNLTVRRVTDGLLEEELEQLFLEHYEMLYSTAYSMLGNPSDAEDVPQTIFLRLLRSGLPPDFQKNPKGYLYRATVNVSLNVIRARRRDSHSHGADHLQVPDNRSESNALEETFRRLGDAIGELHPDAAQILVLRYFHNYSDAEIGKMLGMSRGAIAMKLFRTRARLKKLIRSVGEQK